MFKQTAPILSKMQKETRLMNTRPHTKKNKTIEKPLNMQEIRAILQEDVRQIERTVELLSKGKDPACKKQSRLNDKQERQ